MTTMTTTTHYHIWKYPDTGYQESALFRLATRFYNRNRANRILRHQHDGMGAVLKCTFGDDCRTTKFDEPILTEAA